MADWQQEELDQPMTSRKMMEAQRVAALYPGWQPAAWRSGAAVFSLAPAVAFLSDRWILLNPVANMGDAGPGGQILRIRQLFDHTHRLRSPVHGQRRPGSQTVTDPPNPQAHPPDRPEIHLGGCCA